MALTRNHEDRGSPVGLKSPQPQSSRIVSLVVQEKPLIDYLT